MKHLLQLAVLGAALIAQPALAEKSTICHKGRQTVSIYNMGLPAHFAHGDTAGPCGAVDAPFAVVVLRCDSVSGAVSVVSASGSDEPTPVTLPVIGDNCAAAVAGLLNGGRELEFVTSGTAGVPLEGESGFVTEYTFVSGGPVEDDDDDDDEDHDHDGDEDD